MGPNRTRAGRSAVFFLAGADVSVPVAVVVLAIALTLTVALTLAISSALAVWHSGRLVRVEGGGLIGVERDPKRAAAFLPPDVQARIGDRPVEQWDGGLALSPGIFKGDAPIKVGDPDSDDVEVFNRYIMHYLTPETMTTSHYWWSYTDDFTPSVEGLDEAMTEAFGKVFAEDAWAVDHMQKLLDNDRSDYQELVIGGDKAGLLFRRVVLGWVEAEYGDGNMQR